MRPLPRQRVTPARLDAAGRKLWYTTTEAARLLSISTQSVIRLCDQGHLPHWKTPTKGQYRRIPRDALVEFIRRNGMHLPAELSGDPDPYGDGPAEGRPTLDLRAKEGSCSDPATSSATSTESSPTSPGPPCTPTAGGPPASASASETTSG